MASASAPPCTLFASGEASRAFTGAGPAGVAAVLRGVLQRNPLQSLRFSASQHLQHLQHRVASRVRIRERGAGAFARGFGGVASVASVARLKCIYISMTSPQHPLQRLAVAARQGVADHLCSIGSAAPQAIKYPRKFNGLGPAGRLGGARAGNGVLVVRASRSWARGGELVERLALALDQAETGPIGARSPVGAPPVASESVRSQHVRAGSGLTHRANRGAASCQNPTPPSIRDPHPRRSTAPSSRAPFGAAAAPLGAGLVRRGAGAEPWKAGRGGAGCQGSGAAKTGVPPTKGSGEVAHG